MQTAWVQNESLRDNILFHQPFDQAKYSAVVHACALRSDFAQLAAGDETRAGLRGINLSGGQRQRVNLARAAYFDADIMLLDAPLRCSAVSTMLQCLPFAMPERLLRAWRSAECGV